MHLLTSETVAKTNPAMLSSGVFFLTALLLGNCIYKPNGQKYDQSRITLRLASLVGFTWEVAKSVAWKSQCTLTS